MAFTDATRSYGQLVMFFAGSLLEAYRKASKEFGRKDRLKDIDENMRKIAYEARSRRAFSLNEALLWVPGIGSQTLRARLEKLVEMDILEKTGNTKGLRYSFKDPLASLRRRGMG